jgi:hypothetical protein
MLGLLVALLYSLQCSSYFTLDGSRPLSHSSIFAASALHPSTYEQGRVSSVQSRISSKSSVLNIPIVANSSVNPLPWTKSVNPTRTLTYMPMLKYQLELLRSMGLEEVSIDERIVSKCSSVRPAVITHMCFRSEKFRYVRMSYLDAGDSVQVLSSFAILFLL